MKKSKDKSIVGFLCGNVITKQAFIKSIEKAEARIDRGKFITQEDLEKEAKNW